MDTTGVDRQVAALRAADGAVHTALAEMNARLAVFAAALRAKRSGGPSASSGAQRTRAGPPQRKPRPAGGRSALFDGAAPARAATAERAAKLLAASAREESKNISDEDARLLASLDAETASAIRVKRRLCENGRGVRELLREYRAGRA